MKMLNILLALVFASATFSVNAQTEKKEEVTVYGNCGMCKNRIEKAAKAAGATTANWDSDNLVLSVSFPSDKTSIDSIEKAVATVGHDTKTYRASDEVYNKLHGCCKYERKPADAKKN